MAQITDSYGVEFIDGTLVILDDVGDGIDMYELDFSEPAQLREQLEQIANRYGLSSRRLRLEARNYAALSQ